MVSRGEIDAAQIVACDLEGTARALNGDRFALLETQRAARQGGKLPAGGLEQRARIDGVRPWAAALSDIQARSANGRGTLARGVDPGGMSALAGEMLRDLGSKGGGTGNRPFRGQAVAIDLDGLGLGGSAAVVLVVVVDVRQAAAGIGPQMPDILAADDDGQAFGVRTPHQGGGGQQQRQGNGFVRMCHLICRSHDGFAQLPRLLVRRMKPATFSCNALSEASFAYTICPES
jgi:hypothetical protein